MVSGIYRCSHLVIINKSFIVLFINVRCRSRTYIAYEQTNGASRNTCTAYSFELDRKVIEAVLKTSHGDNAIEKKIQISY